MNTVFIKKYKYLAVDRKEILRYAAAGQETAEISALLEECLNEVSGRLDFKVCYREFDIKREGGMIDLGFTAVASRDLGINLKNCSSIVLFAATAGIELDRLIARYSRISPAKALILQAIGAERIEALCNAFNNDIIEKKAQEGLFARPRFSPGYGDLPLEVQRKIFAVLDCPRKIGLSLNESLLMSPTKSVTAIIGLGKTRGCDKKIGCEACNQKECDFKV